MRLGQTPFAAWMVVFATAPAVAAQDSLADRYPADAILYVSIDTNRLVNGAMNLDLVKLVDEVSIQEFLKPLAREADIEVSTHGLRALLDAVPWRQFVDGRIEIAARGIQVQCGDTTIDLSPSHPLDAKTLNRMGQIVDALQSGGPGAVSMSVDIVASVDAGDGFGAWFEGMLKNVGQAGAAAHTEACRVGGRDATRISFSLDHDAPMQVAYFLRDGKRWWFAGSSATLEGCLAGHGQQTLAHNAQFQKSRALVSSGDSAVMAYLNVANVARMFERFVPPIVKEELDLFGISSIESVGVASSFVEGGVRDSIALSYNAPPTGLVSLLDCVDGGFDYLKVAPAETGFYLGARIDPETFVDKLLAVSEQIAPGSAGGLERALGQADRQLGMSVREELLPAFGDEIGIFLTPPGAGGMLPDGMAMLEIGDHEQFCKLVAKLREHLGLLGMQPTDAKGLPEGVTGFTITPPNSPVQPAFAVTKNALCVAPNVVSLKKALRAMNGGLATCATDNPSLKHVLTGLTGKPSADGLSLLAFVDLAQLVSLGYQFLPMVAGPIQEQTGGKLDLAALPEADVITSHFSGIGIAGRSDQHGLELSIFTPFGVLPAMAAAAAIHHLRSGGMAMLHGRGQPDHAVPAPVPAESVAAGGRTKSLADLFSNLEKATGATISFPDDLAEVQVGYSARSGDLATILDDLARLVGFRYEMHKIDGETFVEVSSG